MKYVPKEIGPAAEVSSGGGNRGMFKEAITLVVLVMVAITAIYGVVSFGTDLVISRFSVEREMQVFSYLDGQLGLVVIPESLTEKWELAEYTLAKLCDCEAVPDLEFTILYIDDASVNAFALPGGKIMLTRGLLESLEGEISFAFVLAHEIGHFVHRDHLRGLGRKIGFQAGLVVLFGGKPDLWASRSADLLLLHYSRTQEAGADEFALECIDSVYDTRDGAEKLFMILEETRNGKLPDWAYMFSTHPDNQERIRKILESKL